MPDTGTLSAPTLIRPGDGVGYRLGARHYTLLNGTTPCVAHLVNCGDGQALVSGCFSGVSGTLTIEAHDAFMIGWHPAATQWRALRMVGTRIVGPEGIPPDAVLDPPADALLWFETLAGDMAHVTLVTAAEYLAGRLPALPGLYPSPVWEVQA